MIFMKVFVQSKSHISFNFQISGVRAVFDKKYVPNWIPAKLEDVSGQDVENHFRFVPKIEALKYKL